MSDTVLLIDFHKKASFRPNMLNYLNATFTFGKQTKDTFMTRKFQCGPTYSFTNFCARFCFGESRGGSSPRRARNISWSTAISHSSAGSTPTREKQGQRCSHSTRSLDDLWAAFLCVQL